MNRTSAATVAFRLATPVQAKTPDMTWSVARARGGRQIALFLCSVFLSACASSEPGNSEIRTVSDPEALVGCTKIAILRESAVAFGILRESAFATHVSGELERRLRAQVTNLGGNTIVFGNVEAIHPYVEVWSCPEEDIVVPK